MKKILILLLILLLPIVFAELEFEETDESAFKDLELTSVFGEDNADVLAEIELGCTTKFTQAKLLSELNKRNINYQLGQNKLYAPNTAFVVSSKEWQDVLKATTLSIWKNNGESCSKYDESYNPLCSYPLLILYEEQQYFDRYNKEITREDAHHIIKYLMTAVHSEPIHSNSYDAINEYLLTGKFTFNEMKKSDQSIFKEYLKEKVKLKSLQDYTSPAIFIQQANIKNVITYNTDLTKNTAEAFSKNGIKNFISTTNMDYLGFWKTGYETVVISENNYEAGIHAAIFASTLNAPLLFENELTDILIQGLSGKKIVLVTAQKKITDFQLGDIKSITLVDIDLGKVLSSLSNNYCHEQLRGLSKKEINEKIPYYMAMNRKIILYNPEDILEQASIKGNLFRDITNIKEIIEEDTENNLFEDIFTANPFNAKDFENIPYRNVFYKDSLTVPYLAIARNQRIVSVKAHKPLPDLIKFNKQEKLSLFGILSSTDNKGKEWLATEKMLSFSEKDTLSSMSFYKKIEEINYYFNFIQNIRSKIIKNNKKNELITYYTLVGSPKSIPFSPRPSELAFGKRETFPTDYYLLEKDSSYAFVARGKIMGFTVSDTSSLVMRNLFFKQKKRNDIRINFLSDSRDLPDQKYFVMGYPLLKEYFPQAQCFQPNSVTANLAPNSFFIPVKNNCTKQSSEIIIEDYQEADINIIGNHGTPDGTFFCTVNQLDCFKSTKEPRIDIVDACLTMNLFDEEIPSAGIISIRYGAKAYYGYEGTSMISNWNHYLPQIFLADYKENLFLGDLSPILYNTLLAFTPTDAYLNNKLNSQTGDKLYPHGLKLTERDKNIGFSKLILLGDPLTTLLPQETTGLIDEKKTDYNYPLHTIIHTMIIGSSFEDIDRYQLSEKIESFSYRLSPSTKLEDSIFYTEYLSHSVFQEYYLPLKPNNIIDIFVVVVSPYKPTLDLTYISDSGKTKNSATKIKDCYISNHKEYLLAALSPGDKMKTYICEGKVRLGNTPNEKGFILTDVHKDGKYHLYDKRNIILKP